jgi:hypothetical protein
MLLRLPDKILVLKLRIRQAGIAVSSRAASKLAAHSCLWLFLEPAERSKTGLKPT